MEALVKIVVERVSPNMYTACDRYGSSLYCYRIKHTMQNAQTTYALSSPLSVYIPILRFRSIVVMLLLLVILLSFLGCHCSCHRHHVVQTVVIISYIILYIFDIIYV